jgi:Nuclease-related domain
MLSRTIHPLPLCLFRLVASRNGSGNGWAGNRWWGPRSDFPWEEDALKHVRGQMPSAEPYRAWQTFTFTARSGHVREVDLFIATPAGLFLVEIKSHPGRASNQGAAWLFHGDDRVRTIENPLHLTNQKCKELKSQLEWAAAKLGLPIRLPYIRAAVFLSAPDLRCEFDEVQATMVFGRDGLTKQTGLDGIWAGLLGQPPRNGASRVDPTLSRQLEKLLQKIGIQGLHKHRKSTGRDCCCSPGTAGGSPGSTSSAAAASWSRPTGAVKHAGSSPVPAVYPSR